MIEVTARAVAGVLLLVPELHTDARDSFKQTHDARVFAQAKLIYVVHGMRTLILRQPSTETPPA